MSALLPGSDFRDALQEMDALGLRVTESPHAGSTPYVVLNAHRSDSRRWLVPLHPRAISVSSLAMIQPVRFGARLLKRAAIGTGGLGLQTLWSPGRVHVSGANHAAGSFGSNARYSAFFTGTAGPHRKTVAQMMDAQGNILGYVKASLTAAAGALLRHEASVVEQLQTLNIQSAWIPNVLFQGTIGDVRVLVTDTVKTLRSECPTRLQMLHVAFLSELTARTASVWAMCGDALLADWSAQVERLANGLPPEWQERFRRAFELLAGDPELVESKGLAHGDFTPFNMFQDQGRLCVFDWEYAGGHYPADYDLVRYLSSLPRLRSIPSPRRGFAIERILVDEFGRTPVEAGRRVIAFLCVYALRGANRQPHVHGASVGWEDDDDQARMLDSLLIRASGS